MTSEASRRSIAALLFLFPKGFRQRYGQDMLHTFDDRLRDQPGWRTVLRTAVDLFIAATGERLSPNSFRPGEVKGDKLMTLLKQDLRFAARTLRRSPGFTAAVLLTLSLGIGVNTAMFSVAHAVLWRSLPYPEADRIVTVGEVDAHDAKSYWGASYPNLLDWRSRAKSFEHLAGVMGVDHILREGDTPVQIRGYAVSYDFFELMGVAPQIGRVFGAGEDRANAAPVIVLSHDLWVSRFGGDPHVLSRSLRFGRTLYAVIGVMPAGFAYRQAEFWTPLEQEIDPAVRSRRSVWVLEGVGRLRRGVSAASAGRAVEAIAAQIRQEYPETRRGLVVRAMRLRDDLGRDLRPAVLVLMSAVCVVLLIACGNIAALMLVHGAARSREMAIRRALGGGGGRLVRQMLTESAVLALTGGVGGIGFAFAAIRSLALVTRDPRLLNVPIDTAVIVFAASVTIITTLLFGVVPAIRAASVAAAEVLKSGPRAGGSRQRTRAQRTLVVVEVALCLVLLSGAGLLMKSFRKVLEVNPGFRADRLVAMRIALPPNYDADEVVARFYRSAQERLSALPGVSAATMVNRLPISGGEGNGDIAIEDRTSAEGELGASTIRGVMPNYFAVMGIPLVRGRMFDEHDNAPGLHPAIINEGFAGHFWPGADPIGKRFKIGPRDRVAWFTIVGVTGDVRQIGLDTPAPFSTYTPLESDPYRRFEVAVRAQGDPHSVLSTVREALRKMEPALLIDKTQTISERIDETVAPRRLNLLLFELFAGLALLLATVGLYGVVAYAASQRVREFAIRLAVGARGIDVLRLVLTQGLKLAWAGTAIGIAATLVLTRFMSGLLFGVEPTDPTTLFAVAGLLVGIALVACVVPAYRAARIAPVEALRME
jgi:putative ABC transport system permease protein